MKWHFNKRDTTIKQEDSQHIGQIESILEVENNTVVISSQYFYGWRIEKINIKNGEVIWENHRNQDFPDSTQKWYLANTILKNKDGNIDILGLKTYNNKPSLVVLGNPVRCKYNISNGKEMYCYIDTAKIYSNFKVAGRRHFVTNGKDYLVLSGLFSHDSTFFIRRIDSNMIVKDTLVWFDIGKDKNNSWVVLDHVSPLFKKGNSLYFMALAWGGALEKYAFNNYFVKIKDDGTLLYKKNIAKEIYYNVHYWSYNEASDGFIVSGKVDTTNNCFKFPDKASNSAFLAKFDTTGIKKWETKLLNPNGEILEKVAIVEGINRKGFWACAGNTKGKSPYLFFINQNGKSKFIEQIEASYDEDNFYVHELSLLSNGDLICAMFYNRCSEAKNVKECSGIGLMRWSNSPAPFSPIAEKLV